MAKIYPRTCLSSLSSSSSSSFSSPPSTSYITSKKEVFTIWMKSLVFNGNGCTVYDSHGKIIYRMDNYDQKHSSQVHLMDLKGNLLFTIFKKKLGIFRCWEAYKYNGLNLVKGKPWFRAKKVCRIFKGSESPTSRQVTVGLLDNDSFGIEGFSGKVACKIVNQGGESVAKVMQKQSTEGIGFGKDVMKLVVEANVDHSLVIGLVVVYSLMNNRM
ncbi:hypothetical protein AQUCO_02000585v1 [Aquilegia coerulea]|uniref:Tubby C-terminal domain-containing protein n=1 Tax=Aquilegia coerulea TaxID=218851 RepID=A0A2G5DI87_AQUCA|nr:hypothetical protein AQUCO_02000585v1 [Aquilegia coerulea]